MKKQRNLFLFPLLCFSFFMIFTLPANAKSKVKINARNFSEQMREIAQLEDANKDGYLSVKEASKVTKLSFESNENTDLFRGIKYFTHLEELWFISNIDRRPPEEKKEEEQTMIQKLDLSGLKRLSKIEIECGNPYLKEIKLKGCTNLKKLCVSGEKQVNLLHINDCVNLQEIDCSWVKIPTLSGLKKLHTADLAALTSKSLTINNCPSLNMLTVSGTKLKKLNLKRVNALETIYLWENAITDLDISNLPKLKKLFCKLPACTSLELKNNHLEILNCPNSTNLKHLDVRQCPRLKSLRCHHNRLKKLNLRKNPKLRVLFCDHTDLRKLILDNNRELKTLNCRHTGIRELNLRKTKIKPLNLRCDEDVSVRFARK